MECTAPRREWPPPRPAAKGLAQAKIAPREAWFTMAVGSSRYLRRGRCSHSAAAPVYFVWRIASEIYRAVPE